MLPTSRSIKSLGSRVWIGGEPRAFDARRFEAGAGFGQQNRANPFSFKSGSDKERPNVSVAWVSRRKADHIAVLLPNGHSRISYTPFIIMIGDLRGVSQYVFDD